jgi:hypothetical protein
MVERLQPVAACIAFQDWPASSMAMMPALRPVSSTRPLYRPAVFAFAIPCACRRRRVVLNHPGPATLLSSARAAAPRATGRRALAQKRSFTRPVVALARDEVTAPRWRAPDRFLKTPMARRASPGSGFLFRGRRALAGSL